jgi:polysaccharide export outer membrane protein
MRALLLLVAMALSTVPAAAQNSEYVLGADDVLHVIVWDNKELEMTVAVRPDGKISYPLAGEIQAQGRTVDELTAVLRERLSWSIKEPKLSVIVKEIRSYRVHFLGRVAKPGPHPITPGTPLLQALSLAGGTTENADLAAAYIIRGDRRFAVDLRRLVQEGDVSRNLVLKTDDVIVVPEIAIGANPQEVPERRIYILGQVARPGVYRIKHDVPLLHALFLAGGVAQGGDMASAFVIRADRKIPVDLWGLLQKGDVSQNIQITHEDMIVVPSGGELHNAVYVMGEVLKPGMYANPEALTVLKLITLAGGFTKYAATSRATLIRADGDRKHLIRVDLKEIMQDPRANGDMALRPGDVVVVPERLF